MVRLNKGPGGEENAPKEELREAYHQENHLWGNGKTFPVTWQSEESSLVRCDQEHA